MKHQAIIEYNDVTQLFQLGQAMPMPPLFTFNKLEERPEVWVGDYSGTESGTPVATNFSRALLPDGTMQMYIAGGAYAGALHTCKLGAHNTAKRFVLSWKYFLDSALAAAIDNVEAEFWMSANKRKYMFGQQIYQGFLYLWKDPNATGPDRWVKTNIAIPRLTANFWHTFSQELHRDDTPGSEKIVYDAFTINGKRYTDFSPQTNIQPTQVTDWSDDMGVQFQQGLGSGGGAGACRVDEVNLVCYAT
jgi:hypothetical protein